MKKGLLVCLVLFASLDPRAFAGSSFDVTRPEIRALYTTASFTIDGSAVDWSGIKARGHGISFYKGDGHAGTSTNLGTTICRIISNEADCRVDLWLAHNVTYLYVLAEVHDDSYEPFAASGNSNAAYLEDTLHLYIDSNNSRTSGISSPPISYRTGYEQFGISTDDNIGGESTDFNNIGGPRQPAPAGSHPDGTHWVAQCGVQSLPGGSGYLYVFEERIALASYRNMAAMTPGNSYGFDAEFCDADNGVQLQGFIWWSSYGGIDAYIYENLWGTMTLNVVPEPSSLALLAGVLGWLPLCRRVVRARNLP